MAKRITTGSLNLVQDSLNPMRWEIWEGPQLLGSYYGNETALLEFINV